MFSIARLSRKCLVPILLLCVWTSSYAVTFPWEHVSGHRSSGIYGWDYSYDIGYFDNTIKVDIDVKLVGADPGSTLRDTWSSWIEGLWSTDSLSVPISFKVDWVTTGEDQTVNVVAGDGHTDMTHWFTGDPAGWGYDYQGRVAAHEYGHMLSLYDEYPGGAVDPVTKLTDTGGLMDTPEGNPFDYYYTPFLNWYAAKEAQISPVPEPETYAMMLAGLALMGAVARRRRQK